MATLVLDIETVGVDFDTLHEDVRATLLRSAQREPTDELRNAAVTRIRDSMSLWPLTARIVAIAMINVDSGGGRVYYESPQHEEFAADDGRSRCVGSDERTALAAFWRDVRHFQRFVTFNGRSFDLPFLMLRSAVLGLRPTRNLMASRHTDLLEELTFDGKTRRFSLEFYCHAFGIDSPKREGVSGAQVAGLHQSGQYREIARYCLRDAVATAELYDRWRETLCFEDPDPAPHLHEETRVETDDQEDIA